LIEEGEEEEEEEANGCMTCVKSPSTNFDAEAAVINRSRLMEEEAPQLITSHSKTSDIEDVMGADKKGGQSKGAQQLIPIRPNSTAFPDKKKGFHKYAKKSVAYREPGTRVLDWEEITVPANTKTKLYDQLLRTQASRCMDCGTPTCHYPNPGGGGCPLGNRIPNWNALVYEGNWKQAIERLLDTNNFPEFTGRICPAPCEESCVLGINEDSVAIKSVEVAIVDYAFGKGWIVPRPPKCRTYKKVAIVGSGPAGLAAAQQLNRAGHTVTVFERSDRIGGLLTYGIPNMKLDKKKIVDRRVEILRQEGIAFKTNTEVGEGKDVTIEQLKEDFDSVLLAIGALQEREFDIPGRQLDGVHQAMEFLTLSQKSLLDSEMLDGQYIDANDKHVVVIGGGDTAVDCLGTAVRMGATSVLQFSRREEAAPGRSDTNPWPQWGEYFRVDYGHSECNVVQGRDPREYCVKGVEFVPNPKDSSKVGGIRAVRMRWQRDAKTGRSSMVPIEGTRVYPADLVLLAMGFTGPQKGTWSSSNPVGLDQKSGNISAQMGEYKTNIPGVFACGDCRRGASLVVWAIAEGRDAAAMIDEFLMGETVLPRAFPESANPALQPVGSAGKSVHLAPPVPAPPAGFGGGAKSRVQMPMGLSSLMPVPGVAAAEMGRSGW